MLSTQDVQAYAGVPNPNFLKLDEDRSHCQRINEASLALGLSMVSKEALDRYNKLGNKLVMGLDLGPFKIGPDWILTSISLEPNADKTQTLVQAPMMYTPLDYFESQIRGLHNCKVFSPYRVIEWVYVDSLYAHDSRAHHTAAAAKTEFIQSALILLLL